MLTFWMIATGFIVIALVLVVPPFFRKTPLKDQIDQQNANVAIYKEKMAELEQENLSATQLIQAKQELERTLLQDWQTDEPLTQPSRAQWAGIVVALVLPGLAIGGYLKSSHLEFIELQPTVPKAEKVQLPANFAAMVDKLVNRLQQHPEDAKGWQMLARAYVVLNRPADAVQAYDKALALTPTDPQLCVDFAETLMRVAQGNWAGRPTELLQMALKLEPNHHKALLLAGLSAAQTENYATTITYWERLLAQLPLDATEDRQAIEAQLTEVRRLLQQRQP